MDLQSTDLLTFVFSAGGIIAVTAAIRKYIPKINGWMVPVLVLALSVIVGVSERILRDPKHWYFGFASGLVLAMVSLGTNEKINTTADRVRSSRPHKGEDPTHDKKPGS